MYRKEKNKVIKKYRIFNTLSILMSIVFILTIFSMMVFRNDDTILLNILMYLTIPVIFLLFIFTSLSRKYIIKINRFRQVIQLMRYQTWTRLFMGAIMENNFERAKWIHNSLFPHDIRPIYKGILIGRMLSHENVLNRREAQLVIDDVLNWDY